jgi:hypothetical protein
MERNRVSPLQAIVAIFVVLLIGLIFLLPLLRSATTATEVALEVTATLLAPPTATLMPPTPLPATLVPATPVPTPIPPTPTLSPTPIPELPTATLEVATATVAPTDTPLPLPTVTVTDIFTATVLVQPAVPLTVSAGVTTTTPVPVQVAITPTLAAEPLAAEPTATKTSTATPEPATDLTFGFLTNRPACQMATEIVAQLLQDSYQLQIRKLAFGNVEELYANVAHQAGAKTPVDLTVCYRFPDDGKYLKELGSLLQILGSDYAQEDKARWYVMTHSSLPLSLRTERICVYELIGQLNFGAMQFPEQDAASWIKNHPSEVALMLKCSKAE